MKYTFFSALITSIVILLLIACSEDSSSANGVPEEPTITSSSSFVSSEQSIPHSSETPNTETQSPISSSSIDSVDYPVFSKFLAQFSTLDEISFDNHVMAYNSSLTPSCEETIVSYDEEERIVPLQAVSNETIEKCFPQTAPLLKQKFISNTEATFYAFVLEMSATPQFAVLNKFAEDGINIVVVNPGGENCILDAWGPIVVFLLANVDGAIKIENIPITNETVQSKIWTCDEKGNIPISLRTYGEWFSDSLL